MREAMIAKSKNIKGKDQGVVTVSAAEAGEFENAKEKQSFLPKYKVQRWQRNYNALKTEQMALKENLKIGMERFCPRDKIHKFYIQNKMRQKEK